MAWSPAPLHASWWTGLARGLLCNLLGVLAVLLLSRDERTRAGALTGFGVVLVVRLFASLVQYFGAPFVP